MRQPLSRQPRGVLHRLTQGAFTHGRVSPPLDLADRVAHFWVVRWHIDGDPQVQETLPHPNVHIVVEPGQMAAWGVHSGRWTRTLEGRSMAFGIKFRPGAFRPLLGRAVATLANTSIGLDVLFGAEAGQLNAVLGGDDDEAAAELAAAFLRERLPPADEKALLAGRIVDSVTDDRELRCAEELARRFGTSVRSLQRLFNDYVGIGPKWVIRRFRLHEALERVRAGENLPWAQLALDLGYFDQAHFVADFHRLVGQTPGDYARSVQAGRQG